MSLTEPLHSASAAFLGRPAWAAAEGWRLTSSSFPPAPRDICGGLASCYGADNESHGGDCHLCFPQESRGLHLGDQAARPFLPLAERYPAPGEHHHLSGPSTAPQRFLNGRSRLAPQARACPPPETAALPQVTRGGKPGGCRRHRAGKFTQQNRPQRLRFPFNQPWGGEGEKGYGSRAARSPHVPSAGGRSASLRAALPQPAAPEPPQRGRSSRYPGRHLRCGASRQREAGWGSLEPQLVTSLRRSSRRPQLGAARSSVPPAAGYPSSPYPPTSAPPAGTCLPLLLPFSSSFPPHAYGWAHARAGGLPACRRGLDEAERLRGSQTGGRLVCALHVRVCVSACVCVCLGGAGGSPRLHRAVPGDLKEIKGSG